MELSFNPDTHIYTIDGAVVPSVTQLLKPLIDYSGIPADVLERAQAFGIAVHTMVELVLAGTLDYGSLDDGLLNPLAAFDQWRRDYPAFAERLPTAIVERPMWHKRLGFAGKPDLILDGFAIVDVKTRLPNLVADAIQDSGYEMLHLENGGTKAKYGHYVLHLPASGPYKFQKLENREAPKRFRHLLDLYHMNKALEAWR